MSEKTDVWLGVLADMESRRQKGLADYGVPVTAGCDLKALLYWLRHRYDELLDDAVYTRAAIGTVEPMLAAIGADHAAHSTRAAIHQSLLARAERQEHFADPNIYPHYTDDARQMYRHAAAMLRLAAAELEDNRNKV